jgi:alanine dehydrogenase
MQIGVPRETKVEEYRVAATPDGVRELVGRGHDVVAERGAGDGSSFPDRDYRQAGATLGNRDEAWGAELVLKVKEPQPSEYRHLRDDLTLFTYLHLAADPPLADALIDAGTTAIAYETVRDAAGRLPLLAPMSEVAGQLAVLSGVTYLQKPRGGRGLLPGAVPGIPPARVVIVGGGAVGYNAALIALGVGAHVQLLDTSVARLRELETMLFGSIELLVSTPGRLADCIAHADLVVGAVLVPGASAPKVITAEMVGSMRPGSVICDVSIDQGGCCETSRPTTYADPVYEHDGVIHCCVANLPGAVPVSSTLAVTNATLPYVIALADRGWREAVSRDPALAGGLNVCDGRVTHPAVAAALDLEYTPVDDVLGPAYTSNSVSTV